ncbi:hypothetical protein [Absidia glauca]|uniref:Uncharacterized protein n=1 Tax=Absidia glauca TaxID=4829 RepID=A0A163JH67_ABSGL|nr:hypothetical protein [Absidia glauca]
MNIIAPSPQKPTTVVHSSQDEMDDACSELRQILQQSQANRTLCLDDPRLIPRTNNPLPLDSSFVPLHQTRLPDTYRPRSLSVG